MSPPFGFKATAAVGLAFLALLAGCRHRCPPSAHRLLHRPPALGRRLVVLAPHPDDEALAAGGLIARTLERGGEVHVVVATDGEAGVNRTHAPDLAAARRDETRRVLATLGVAPAAVAFLGYANNGLGGAWSQRWRAERPGGAETSGDAVVAALGDALRAADADTVVVPMPLDEHVDHRALARFALLAVLGLGPAPRPAVLGYLVHGEGRWPTCRPTGFHGVSPVPPGCAGLLPWTGLPVDAAFKATLLREYRTQLGATLLRYASGVEPFAKDGIVAADRAASAWRPGLHRAAGEVVITVPRTACLVDGAAGERLRLRYFRAGAIEERVITLGPGALVRGGRPGGELVPSGDVRAAVRRDAVHLALDARSFRDVGGAVLEVIAPARRATPAWLLRWS